MNPLELATTPRRGGVIGWLRSTYPHENWKAIRMGWGSWGYEGDNGVYAHWCSCMAPRYDGDDESYVSRFYIYRPHQQPEHVYFA